MTSEASRAAIRYVAIGDSFTEGIGDEHADGTPRGWADLVAQGLAEATGRPIQYANLAVRGRLLDPMIAEQLEPALALGPTLLSFNGGGNDMIRPRVDLASVIARTEAALHRVLDAGVRPVLLAGANPATGLPRGTLIRARGDRLSAAATDVAARLGIAFCDNWNDPVLAQRQYWAVDRLHLSVVGHHRAAANVLRSLGYPAPPDWPVTADPLPRPTMREQLAYAREHVMPWVGRRLTGRSSGDGRTGKFLDWVWVEPRAGRERPATLEPPAA